MRLRSTNAATVVAVLALCTCSHTRESGVDPKHVNQQVLTDAPVTASKSVGKPLALPADAERILGSSNLRADWLVTDLAFAKDALVSVDGNAKVQRWSLEAGELLSSFDITGHRSGIYHALSRDGAMLAAVQRTEERSGADEFITVWDAVTGKKKTTFTHHPESINDLAFSPDGKTLITADSDNRLRLWDVETGKVVREFDGKQPLEGGIMGLSEFVPEIWEEIGVRFSSNGTLVATAQARGKNRVRDMWSGKLLVAMGGAQWGPSPIIPPDEETWEEIGASFSADGTLVATVHAEGENRVHDVSSGKILVTMDGTGWGITPAPVILPGNETVAYVSHNFVKILSLKTGKDIKTLKYSKAIVIEKALSLAVSPDGKRLAIGTTMGRVHIYDLDGSRAPRIIAPHADLVDVVVFSPDSKHLASAGRDGMIGLWDAATGMQALPLVRHFGWITDFEVSPDGSLLASAGQGASVHVWNLETGKLVHSLRSEQHDRRDWIDHVLAFTSDGKLLYSGSTEGDLVAWHVSSGKEALRVDSPVFVSDMALSPDGKTIALASPWGHVVLVDPENAAVRKTLPDPYSRNFHLSIKWLVDGTLVSTNRYGCRSVRSTA